MSKPKSEKDEKGEEERKRRQTNKQINKKQRKRKTADDWGEKGLVAHPIPCQNLYDNVYLALFG